MYINTNIPALNAHRNLKKTATKQSTSFARLSSGTRINSAADDAAGLSISENMKAQIRGMKQAQRNVDDGINLIKTMERGMEEIQNMMVRQRELIVQGLNATNDDTDRDKLQVEIDQLTAGTEMIAEGTTFNSIPLLAGKETEQLAPVDVCFVLDVSGSMSGALNNIKNSIESFMNILPPNSRVGFVIYSDHLSLMGEPMKTFSPSSDVTSVKDFINGVTLMNGGDYEEAGLEAIVEAVNLWDGVGDAGDNRKKHIIKITDALSHTSADSTPYGGYTVAEINDLLKTKGIIFDAALSTTDSSVINQVTAIGSGTGGTISTAQDYHTWNWDENIYLNDRGDLWIQTGANTGDGVYINRYDCRPKELYKYVFDPNTIAVEINGVMKEIKLDKLVVKPWEDAKASLIALDEVSNRISAYRAKAGAQQNRLEYTDSSLAVSFTNLEEANSRIADTDMAKEMMTLMKSNVLQQAALSMLAQANQHHQSALALLRA